MTQVMLQIAEDFFLANDAKRAYRMAKTALQLDPFYGDGETIDRYVAAYRVHAAALKKFPNGEPDWYNILGYGDDYSVPGEEIAHLFCKMYKLINAEDYYSAAAKGANKLLGKAFEIVGDMDTRIAFHKRWNLPLVFREKLGDHHLILKSRATIEPARKTEEERSGIQQMEPCNHHLDSKFTTDSVRKRQEIRWTWKKESSNHHLTSKFSGPAARKLQQERSVKKMESSGHHLKSTLSEPAARKLQQERSVKKTESSDHHLKSKFSEPAARKHQEPQERWATKKMEISVRHMNTARRSTASKSSSLLKPSSVGIFKKQGSRSSSFVPRRMFK